MNLRPIFASISIASLGLASAVRAQGSGPDVIVGDLPAIASYGSVAGVSAFSLATTSCNQGTLPLNWFAGTNQHPVISGSLYRYRMVNGAGQFEQIGISQLKHGYFALSGTVCFTDCVGDPTGHTLGVHCSDPYGASTNGVQTNLGPRSDVNAFTGAFPYPFTNRAFSGPLARRLQVADPDLLPANNPGAIYLAEGHYVAPDDAAANNAANNASYRRYTLGGTAGNYTFAPTSGFSTIRTRAAIFGWREIDSAVTIVTSDVPGEGRFQLAYRVSPLENGLYHYEYCLHNLNSDRSGASFTILYPQSGFQSCIQFQNVGFRDVAYDPTEPYDGTDWAFERGGAIAGWTMAAPFGQNPNGNALRWGTSYTFRFDSPRPPTAGTVEIGLFRPGTPSSISAPVMVPASCECQDTDYNGDGNSDANDVDTLLNDMASGSRTSSLDPDYNQDGNLDMWDIDFLINLIAGGRCGG